MRSARAVLGAGALAAMLSSCAAGVEPAPSATPGDLSQEQTPTAGPTASSASDFRDGEYSATGWYGSLPSHHDVTLTIENDTVTAVTITTPAEDQTSLGYQQRFAAALPEAVVGRDLGEIVVDRLAGSSGCSEGFMDALRQIREQAAA